MTIVRPPTEFEPVEHTYALEGQELVGISSAAKIGGALETWGIASAWGFRIGYEGAYRIRNLNQFATVNELREALLKRGLSPWSTRDKAADRGTWVHDVLEGLAQRGDVPDLSRFSDEYRGHAQAVMKWYVDFRPVFHATEVQVTSTRLGLAGRYDIEAHIEAWRLLPLFKDHLSVQHERVEDLALSAESDKAFCLIDLKTSKGVYPTTHFPQLSGYEICRVEMGFEPTDAQFVLNTHPDGTYEFAPSWTTAEDFEGLLGAFRSIRSVEANDPEVRRRGRREEEVLPQLPARFKDIAIDNPAVLKGLLSGMKKRGRVTYNKGVWELRPEEPGNS